MHYRVYLAIGVFLIGVGMAGAPQIFPMEQYPTLWWVMACATLFPGLVFLGLGILNWYRGEPSAVQPDLDLDAFVDGWLGFDRHEIGNKDWNKAERVMIGTNAALDSMAEAARLEQITVWGRKNCVIPGSVPRGPILAKEWDRISVDMLEFLSGKESSEVRAQSDGGRWGTAFYTDICLNRAQVLKLWPKIKILKAGV